MKKSAAAFPGFAVVASLPVVWRFGGPCAVSALSQAPGSGRSYKSSTYFDQSNARDAIDQACYTSDAFWRQVDDAADLPSQSERFRGFCSNLRNGKPGEEVALPSGQRLLTQYVFPGIGEEVPRSAYPAHHYPELQKLQRRLRRDVQPAARRELDLLMRNRPLVDDDSDFGGMDSNDGDTWQRAAWYGWQYLSLRGAKRFMPETVRALRMAMGTSGPAHRFVGISRQKAGCQGVEHSDGRNYMLSTLTPVLCPEGCGIVVDGTDAVIQDEPVILDNTFLHHVYNRHSDIDRFVLMSECWHPALTLQDREAIAKLFAVKDRFTVLELELAPWGYDDDSLEFAISTGAVRGLDFWKDIGYAPQKDATSKLESRPEKRSARKRTSSSSPPAKGFGSKK
jgi:hypothetical protein